MLQIPTITNDEFEELDATSGLALRRARYRTVIDAGFENEAALAVAVHLDVDLGTAVALLDRRCPVDIISRILG